MKVTRGSFWYRIVQRRLQESQRVEDLTACQYIGHLLMLSLVVATVIWCVVSVSMGLYTIISVEFGGERIVIDTTLKMLLLAPFIVGAIILFMCTVALAGILACAAVYYVCVAVYYVYKLSGLFKLVQAIRAYVCKLFGKLEITE